MLNYQLKRKLKLIFIGRKALRGWLIILLTAGAIYLGKYVIYEDYFPLRFGTVERGYIYRSGQLDKNLVEKTLVKYKIDLIVCLSGDAQDDDDVNAERQAAAKLGIKRVIFSMRGNGTADVNDYAKAIAAIFQARKEDKQVLVHCASGAQRTGGVIAMYRLLVQKKAVPVVIDEMKGYGWYPARSPNLLPFLNSNMKELAILLKKMGVINDIPCPLPELKI